jgi:O-antigen/teichoic acid export membrane protein
MGIYAYFEIINVILKLLIVYLLVIGDFDKLILYAVLTLAVSIFMILINRLYCIKHFKESRFHWIWDKSILRPIFTFSMLDIYGNMCATMSNQGVNLIINYFFGVICNAAVSVAQMVQGTIMKLTSTVSTAFRPQIIKLYAQNRIAEMQVVMTNSLKFNILAYSIISIPCFFEAHYVLNLWLGQVPTYSVAFLRVIIIVNFLEANVRVNNIAIHATGRIKRLSFINGSLYLTSPLFMWFAFKLGAVSWMSYVIYGIVLFIILISGLRIISKQISNFKILKFAYDSIKLYVIVLICAIFVSFIIQFLQETFLRVVITTLLFFIILSVLSWFTLLDRDNKIVIVNQIRKYKSKLKLKRF